MFAAPCLDIKKSTGLPIKSEIDTEYVDWKYKVKFSFFRKKVLEFGGGSFFYAALAR